MANNLFVSYEFNQPNQDQAPVVAGIKMLGDYKQVLASVWYVKSSFSVEDAIALLNKAIATGDRVFIIDATNNKARALNIDPNSADFVNSQWSL